MSFAIFDNHTGLEAMMLPMPDGQGGEATVVIVKAAFDIDDEGEPTLSETPAELLMTDVFEGEPKLGRYRAESDLVLFKPRVDILIHDAHAYAPGGQATRELFAELHVGYPGGPRSNEAAHDASQAQLLKSVKVSGDRIWVDGAPSDAMPFVEMPLTWDRTWGGTLGAGTDEAEADDHNPFGIGWRGARSADPEVRSELPNVESADHLVSARESVGKAMNFGMVARAWLPRRALAGTYDRVWRSERWPCVPYDYDPAFAQVAPPDQQIASYGGNEPVRMVNMTPEGEWLLRLPKLDIPVHMLFDDRLEQQPLRVDTVEIEPRAKRLTLTARASVPLTRGAGRLVRVVLGHVKPGWLRAQVTGKCYLDLRNEKGLDPSRPLYR